MRLNNIHPTTGSYNDDRNNFIKEYENAALAASNLAFLDAHAEGTSMAFGYGYDLYQNLSALRTDLAAFVSNLPATSGVSTVTEALQNVYDLITNNIHIVKDGNGNNIRVFKGSAAITSEAQLQDAINKQITLSTEANAIRPKE